MIVKTILLLLLKSKSSIYLRATPMSPGAVLHAAELEEPIAPDMRILDEEGFPAMFIIDNSISIL